MSSYRINLMICAGTGCVSNKAFHIKEALDREIKRHHMDKEILTVMTGCNGFCAAGPIMLVQPDGSFYQKIQEDDIPYLVEEHFLKGRPVKRLMYQPPAEAEPIPKMSDISFFKKQILIALRNKGIVDPEKKRKIIGRTFIKAFENEARKLQGVEFLAQGTLYPDIIESRSTFGGPSAVIKSHHNVGGLPKKMNLKLIEPLKHLFKDEVRVLGEELGLSENLVWRQPFPGPGLAIRIIGDVTRPRLSILRQVDAILLEEIRAKGLYKKLWQSFAVLLPLKSVGIMGDQRTYENIVAVRAVTSVDAMTADWAKLPHSLLGRISNRVINEVRGVNRVVYDISSKPPSTIEWE